MRDPIPLLIQIKCLKTLSAQTALVECTKERGTSMSIELYSLLTEMTNVQIQAP